MTRLTADEVARRNARNRGSWPGKPVPWALGHDEPPTKPKKPPRAAQGIAGSVSSVRVILPWPPSVNHYWRRNKGQGMHISAEGKAYQGIVAIACLGCGGVMGKVAVQVTACPPDRRKRDLDNILKALLDALNHTGMIEDDSHIDDLHITRSEVVNGGRVDVVITAIAAIKEYLK